VEGQAEEGMRQGRIARLRQEPMHYILPQKASTTVCCEMAQPQPQLQSAKHCWAPTLRAGVATQRPAHQLAVDFLVVAVGGVGGVDDKRVLQRGRAGRRKGMTFLEAWRLDGVIVQEERTRHLVSQQAFKQGRRVTG
jgi:hypothetical protein